MVFDPHEIECPRTQALMGRSLLPSESLLVSPDDLLLSTNLQVLCSESRSSCDAGEHPGTKLFIVMKGKNKVRPAGAGKCTMRTALALDGPANTKKPCQDTSSPRARPLAHEAAKEMLTRSGLASPCSRRSASTRRARA